MDKSAGRAEVTKKYIQDGVEDEFGVVYSRDGKRLLDGRNLKLECYEIKNGTEVICESAFTNNDLSLRQITIPDTVTIIEFSAFEWCHSLQQIKIPNSVKLIGNSAFAYCTSLRQVTMSNSVTSIEENVFCDCEALEQIDIPNSVSKIGNKAFWGCSSLKQINIPNSVTRIGDSAFVGCIALKQITIPDSVTMVGKNPFVACHNLYITSNSSRFVIDNECLTDNHKVIIAYFGKKMRIVIPDTVTIIGDSAFEVCFTLKHITIPRSVTEIGNGAFVGCTMSQIEIPNSVKTIGNSVFGQCHSLQKITLSNSVTTISASAFSHCTSLKKISIPESVKKIDYGAFGECKALQQIFIPESVTTIGDFAFKECVSLQQIIIPDSVTMIGKGAFYDCRRLLQVVMSNSITTIEDSIFLGCESLKQITIPDSVTKIGNEAFKYCQSLNVRIPDSVTTIGENAFYKKVDDDFYNLHKKDGELSNGTLDYHTKKLMIKKMVIKNFRAYEEEEVFFDDFNCIIGKNDSGKSTIFAALEWFFDATKNLNDTDLYLGHNFYVQKNFKYDYDLAYDISVEVYFTGVISKLDNDCFDKDGYVCIRKQMDYYDRGRNTKYFIKKFTFEQMNGKALSDCNLDELVQEYKKINNQSEDVWKKIQQLKNVERDENDYYAGSLSEEIKQQICESLYIYFSNSKRVEQWIKIDDIDRFKSKWNFWNSYKLYIYTPYTSLNNYLNDFLKIKYSESIEDIKKSMSEDLSESLEDNHIFETIKFEKNETIDLFTNDNLLLSSGSIPLNNRGKGIQLKIKNAIFKIFTSIQSENQNTIFAFEEPETHLHPSAQIEMYETIKKLSEKSNYQVFITTHSPYIVKQLAKDNINPIVVKRDENLKVSKISKLEERVLPYISMNEINYIAFDEPSIEYHIELFGFIQQKTKKNPGGVDSWLLENKYAKREYDYYQVDANSQLIPDKKGGFQHSDKTLPYCVRNQIDHPNDINKQYENRDYIRSSIDIMRNAILNNPDIFQKKE